MKKQNKLNILFFIILIFSYQSYGIEDNSISANNNCDIIKNIKKDFKNLCNIMTSLSNKTNNFLSAEIQDEFENEVENKSEPLKITLLPGKPLTYSKFLGFFNMPKEISATKKHIYNASKIPLTTGYGIVAEGPNHITFKNFLALLGENQANISISLVSKGEFARAQNTKISTCLSNFPEDEFVVDEMQSDITSNDPIRDRYSIKIIDSYISDEANLEYELLLINDKYHFRMYNTNWLDNCVTDLDRITHIILFMQEIKKLSIFDDNNNNPKVVVNCNAGVGRAGTFITIWNLIENYLNNQEVLNIAEFIVNARKYRSCFVFNADQYAMIKYFSQNLQKYIDAI